MNDSIERIEKVSGKKSRSIESFQKILDRDGVSQERFDALMQKGKPIRSHEIAEVDPAQKQQKPSLRLKESWSGTTS